MLLLLMELPRPELMLVLLLRFVELPFKKLGLDGKGMDSMIPSSQTLVKHFHGSSKWC